MLQTQPLTKKPLADVGEEIGLELGVQMVKDFQVVNPTETAFFIVGRNIIDQILAQPDCAGIKFLSAYNEMGEKTFVYIGIDSYGKSIIEYTVINNIGNLVKENGIVADRVKTGDNPPIGPKSIPDADDWSWVIG